MNPANPEAGECRKSVDLRQEKGGALLLNASAFFDLAFFS
jgi:hypothetical protein